MAANPKIVSAFVSSRCREIAPDRDERMTRPGITSLCTGSFYGTLKPMHSPTAFLAAIALTASVLHAQLPQYDHIVVVVEENHAARNILGNLTEAPFINSLAARGVSLTNMAAILHPSQPNYLELFSGSTQGVRSNNKPGSLPFTTPNLAAALRAAGKTFIGYSQGLPSAGDATTVSTLRYETVTLPTTPPVSFTNTIQVYARKHVPWTNWQSSVQPQPPNTVPPSVNLPFTRFPSNFNLLPDVAFVIPDQDHDMHNAGDPIAKGDRWLKKHLEAYANWAGRHNSLLIVTWDEDDFSSGNRIPTILVGAHLRPGKNAGAWTLHNLLRTLTDLNGLAPIGRTDNVSRISGIFEGENPVATRTFQRGAAYDGVHDTALYMDQPDRDFGDAATGTLQGTPAIPIRQALVRFDDLFGAGPGQIPAGTTIVSAQLRLTTLNTASSATDGIVAVHRMKQPWSEASTWNSFTDGVGIDDVEANATPDFTAMPVHPDDYARFDVTSAVSDWALGGTNDGWLVRLDSSDNWTFALSEYGVRTTNRPALEITFEASELAFDAAKVRVAEDAGSVTLTVHRTGAVNADAACDFTTIDGTARAGRDYTAMQGTLTWAAGDASDRTISVPILTDRKAESGETFTVKLRSPTGIATFGPLRKALVVIKNR